jgi:hypothetical protein
MRRAWPWVVLACSVPCFADSAPDARNALEEAKAAVIAHVQQSEEFKQAAVEERTAAEELAKARQSGTPQQKLDASSKWTKARDRAKALTDKAVREDKRVKEAQARLNEIIAQLEAETKAAREAQAKLEKRELDIREALRRPIGKLELGSMGRLEQAIRVLQVIGKDTALVEYGSATIMLKNINTTGMVDGQRIKATDVFLVADTTSYNTVVGATKTVFVLVPVTEDQLRKAREQVDAAK